MKALLRWYEITRQSSVIFLFLVSWTGFLKGCEFVLRYIVLKEFQLSKIQRQKKKRKTTQPQTFTTVLVTCLGLNFNILLHSKKNKTNISSGPHAASRVGSVALKVAPRQPRSGGIKMSGIQVWPQDETDVLAGGVDGSCFSQTLNSSWTQRARSSPHLAGRVSVLQSNVRHEVSRTPQTRYICSANCCCWSGEHTL